MSNGSSPEIGEVYNGGMRCLSVARRSKPKLTTAEFDVWTQLFKASLA